MQAHVVKHPQRTRFAASAAEARAIRITMMEDLGVKKASIAVDPVEIPTSKADLIDFLNQREKSREAAV